MKLFVLAFWICLPVQAQFANLVLDRETEGERAPAEPTIAINPNDRDNIVAAAILDKVYTTKDGGKTWHKQRVVSPHGVWGDPALAAAANNTFYFFHLSDPTGRNWRSEEILDRIVCQKSTDGGLHWSEGSYMGYAPPTDQDKEWAVVDPRDGTVYVTWTRFDRYGSTDPQHKSNILFARSRDGGEHWSEARVINAMAGDCLDDDGTTEGAVPAVGPDGQVFVAWALGETIWFDCSGDGGENWLAEDRPVARIHGGWSLAVPGVPRCNGMPVTACDLSQSPWCGSVYVLWADQRNGVDDTDIWLAISRDGGRTWSEPKRVNDDPPGNHQFFPWLAVDPVSGYLYAVFYDRRGRQGRNTDVTLAWSTDGGETFRNRTISETPFKPMGRIFLGDYTNIAAHGGRICPIWTRMDQQRTSILTCIIEHEQLVVGSAPSPAQ